MCKTFAYFIAFIPGCLVVFLCCCKWHSSLKFIFLFIVCWHIEKSKFLQKKKKTKLEYYHFATPSELMYLGIDQQQLFSSVQFSCSVMSDSLQPHGLQHSRLPCPSPTPGVYSNSCPLSQWCHPSISSSVIPFSSHFQSFPASGSFPVSWIFASGGQSIGASIHSIHVFCDLN